VTTTLTDSVIAVTATATAAAAAAAAAGPLPSRILAILHLHPM
jgi:hypothetical protein